MSSGFSGSWEIKGFSFPSFGRRDSVEPLFFNDRVGGRSLSVSRANSICRRAICPLSSSSLSFHSGTEVQSVSRASIIEKFAILETVRSAERIILQEIGRHARATQRNSCWRKKEGHRESVVLHRQSRDLNNRHCRDARGDDTIIASPVLLLVCGLVCSSLKGRDMPDNSCRSGFGDPND